MKNWFMMGALLVALQGFAQKKITISDIYERGTFRTSGLSNVSWTSEGSFFTVLQNNNIVKYDISTGEVVETLLNSTDLSPQIRIQSYIFSGDEKKVLLMTERESIYRRSFRAQYYVFDMESKELKALSPHGKQSYATFSPDGNNVAFVRDNNLFLTDLNTWKETALTTDGKLNEIINGTTDWVHEEELSFVKAFFWSPDSKKIAFYRFDESGVKTYNMQKWNNGELYPEDYVFKYPKAGEMNSTVEIFIYELGTSRKTKVDIGTETDIYIARADWTQDANLLSLRRLNRLQNTLDILHVNASTGASEVVFTEKSETYVDIDYCDDLTYLKDGKHFIRSSESDGFKHLYLHTMDGKLVRQLTTGSFEVTRFIGIDESKKRPEIYFIAAKRSALDRGFYKTDIRGKKMEALSPERGVTSVDVNNDFTYYIRNYQDEKTPVFGELVNLQTNQVVKKMYDNDSYKKITEEYGFVSKEFMTVQSADGVTDLNAYMLKPANFNPDNTYPLLVFQYSGPGSQNVSHSWGGGANYYWHQMLTQQGYIVAVVDTRGTGYRGVAFKKMTYGQLGKYESEDHIAAARQFGEMDYIDAKRLGIWGWSYGGYMSSLSLFKGADVFKTAIAVAPVTNWRFYDTIYTERYMGLPQANGDGYDTNSPTYHASKLEGNLLLVHGTGDDNVHFQNAVTLQNELISHGKQYESFYYPDRAHGIYRNAARPHLFEMMTRFILEKL